MAELTKWSSKIELALAFKANYQRGFDEGYQQGVKDSCVEGDPALLSLLAQIEEAIAPLVAGEHWGKFKAWVVEGAPSRTEGVAAAAQITRWQVAVSNAIGSEEA